MKTAGLLLPLSLLVLLSLVGSSSAQTAAASGEVDAVYPAAHDLYIDLHQSPELSSHETKTAAKLAGRLRDLGYTVTEGVGGTGVVAILKNGAGPTVMLRTELDALPVEEKTGLPYASKVHANDDAGHDVPVMHACGHDLHMASLVGTAAIMAHSKESWHGTLMLVGQPAEETISGAKRMIDDGLFTRFPKPAVGVALHVGNYLPAGQVGITPGVYDANADSLRITIYGKGGHGASPQSTIDPIVIAARTILALQTIVSREVKPGEMAVVTVGYVRAGTKNNIIPDQAEMGLTVRTYKNDVRKQVLAAITRITKAEALAGGAQQEPLIEHPEATDSVYNDPALAERLRAPLEAALGKQNVITTEPVTPSEDYAFFVEQGIPSLYMSLGGADPQKYAESKSGGVMLPSNHSPYFAPDVDPALHTGIKAEVAVLRHLLNGAPVVRQYPNTAAGLEELMNDMIALQKKGDTQMLVPYLQSLVLPDAEHWFVAEFGDDHCADENPGADDCMGPRFASSYQRLARAIPSSFALTLQDLLDEGLTNFEAANITEECSGPIRIVPDRKLLGGLTTTPMVSAGLPGPVKRHEPVYALWIYSESKQTTMPFFVYSEGGFRYLGMLHEAAFDEFRKEKSMAEIDQPAPDAHYLTEDQLEVKNSVVDPALVQRTVVLGIVAGADGEPREVTYIRGPEAYKEAAIKSAKKRRFDVPKLPFEAFHAKTVSLCEKVVAPR